MSRPTSLPSDDPLFTGSAYSVGPDPSFEGLPGLTTRSARSRRRRAVATAVAAPAPAPAPAPASAPGSVAEVAAPASAPAPAPADDRGAAVPAGRVGGEKRDAGARRGRRRDPAAAARGAGVGLEKIMRVLEEEEVIAEEALAAGGSRESGDTRDIHAVMEGAAAAGAAAPRIGAAAAGAAAPRIGAAAAGAVALRIGAARSEAEMIAYLESIAIRNVDVGNALVLADLIHDPLVDENIQRYLRRQSELKFKRIILKTQNRILIQAVALLKGYRKFSHEKTLGDPFTIEELQAQLEALSSRMLYDGLQAFQDFYRGKSRFLPETGELIAITADTLERFVREFEETLGRALRPTQERIRSLVFRSPPDVIRLLKDELSYFEPLEAELDEVQERIEAIDPPDTPAIAQSLQAAYDRRLMIQQRINYIRAVQGRFQAYTSVQFVPGPRGREIFRWESGLKGPEDPLTFIELRYLLEHLVEINIAKAIYDIQDYLRGKNRLYLSSYFSDAREVPAHWVNSGPEGLRECHHYGHALLEEPLRALRAQLSQWVLDTNLQPYIALLEKLRRGFCTTHHFPASAERLKLLEKSAAHTHLVLEVSRRKAREIRYAFILHHFDSRRWPTLESAIACVTRCFTVAEHLPHVQACLTADAPALTEDSPIFVLLEAGLSPNVREPGTGNTLMHLAIEKNWGAVMELLAQRGADMELLNRHHQKPAHMAAMGVRELEDVPPIFPTMVDYETMQNPAVRVMAGQLADRMDRGIDDYEVLVLQKRGRWFDWLSTRAERGAQVALFRDLAFRIATEPHNFYPLVTQGVKDVLKGAHWGPLGRSHLLRTMQMAITELEGSTLWLQHFTIEEREERSKALWQSVVLVTREVQALLLREGARGRYTAADLERVEEGKREAERALEVANEKAEREEERHKRESEEQAREMERIETENRQLKESFARTKAMLASPASAAASLRSGTGAARDTEAHSTTARRGLLSWFRGRSGAKRTEAPSAPPRSTSLTRASGK